MTAAAIFTERPWDGVTFDPAEPDVTGYITIPDLPPVVGSEVACPECGQTLDVICGAALIVPRRHYRRPHARQSSSSAPGPRRWVDSVATGDRVSRTNVSLCPFDGDHLNGVIARAQRAAAL